MTILEKVETLRHMLGVSHKRNPKQWGLRNTYATGESDKPLLDEMVTDGLVIANGARWGLYYYSATELGCKVAGLSEKQIKQAIEWINCQSVHGGLK